VHEQGRVVTVRDGTVDVHMEVSAGCGGCTLCSQGAGGETVMHEVRDPFGTTVGDLVDVVIPDTVQSRAAIAVFVVPVLALMGGYLAGFLLSRWAGWGSESPAIVLALASAVIAIVGIRVAERRLAHDERYAPRVNAIIARSHQAPQAPTAMPSNPQGGIRT
jgi:positive regulator of sigma E activity